MLLILPWLLRHLSRAEYLEYKQQHGESVQLVEESGQTAWLLLGLIVARFTFNALLRGPTQRLAQRRGSDAHHRDGSRLLEECWVVLGNTAMLVGALYVVVNKNGGCWFADTSSCLVGWPNQRTDPAVKAYYHAELAWYLHMLLKPVLGYGLKDGRDMLVHHCATLALLLVSYGTELQRLGALVLATFALSNPLLHAAKICNQLSLGPLKIGGFLIFAAAFFLSRVLLVPWAVLKPAMWDTRAVIPYVRTDFPAIYWGINALLALLYLMQLAWMRGIVRVVRSAVTHGADAASRMSTRVDPAKRYAVLAEPAASSSGEGGAVAGAGTGTSSKSKRSPPPTPCLADSPAAALSPGLRRAMWLVEGSGETCKVK